jgi:hypothetical protein
LQVGFKGPVKLLFMEHDRSAQAFIPNGAEESLHAERLPRAARSDAFPGYPPAVDPAGEGRPVN